MNRTALVFCGSNDNGLIGAGGQVKQIIPSETSNPNDALESWIGAVKSRDVFKVNLSILIARHDDRKANDPVYDRQWNCDRLPEPKRYIRFSMVGIE